MKKEKARKTGFSKKLLIADYIIAISLIAGFFACVIANGIYTQDVYATLLSSGVDPATIVVPQLFSLDGFGALLATWVAQLGIASGAYYWVVKTERKIQMPMFLINDLPKDVKDSVDMTQLITSVLSMTE